MITCTKLKTKIVAAVCAASALTLIFCLAPLGKVKLNFKTTFYYVCYDTPRDAHSASSVSSAVQSYGGAAYTLCHGGDYFVTVACYYDELSARSVCAQLNERAVPCSVLKIEVKDLSLPRAKREQARLFEGNLNTMYSLSEVCYNIANSLDGLEYTQERAQGLLSDVRYGLNSLLRQNGTNCFCKELTRLVANCDDVSEGYLLPREVRRLQIVITDCIANINLC